MEKYSDDTKNIAIVSHSENLKAYLNKAFANCEVLKLPQNEFWKENANREISCKLIIFHVFYSIPML